MAARVATFMRQFLRPHLMDFYEEVLALPEEHERLKAIAGYILSKKLTTIANRQIQAAVRTARKLTSKEITPVFEQLEAMGWLFRGLSLRGGAPRVRCRPTCSYRFCPARRNRNRATGEGASAYHTLDLSKTAPNRGGLTVLTVLTENQTVLTVLIAIARGNLSLPSSLSFIKKRKEREGLLGSSRTQSALSAL